MSTQPETMQYTASSADQIDRQMHQEQHPPDVDTSIKTATFSLTPYGQILVHVVDRGYPREGIIEVSQLVRYVTRAIELDFTVIDHTRT